MRDEGPAQARTRPAQPFEGDGVAPTAVPSNPLSNPLLDVVGPATFGPGLALLFWGAAPTWRVLLAAGTYTVLTLVSALALWTIARRLPQHYERGEAAWSCTSSAIAAIFPWLLAPQVVWGHYAVGLVFVAIMSSDALYSALRPNRPWKVTLAVATISTGVYLVSVGLPVVAACCTIFGLHVGGGHDAIQALVRSLRSQSDENAELAETDPLTGLANRRVLSRFLQAAMQRPGTTVTVAALDIDDFKQINDRHGHAGGDVALVALADHLRASLGPEWTAVRSGGDEFVCITSQGTANEARAALRRIPSQIFEDRVIPITVSVGFASGEASEMLLADASAALRIAKQRGKHQTVEVDEALRTSLSEARRLGRNLAEALHRGEIEAHVQPIVRVEDDGSHSVHSFECLARWTTEDGTSIPPSTFIPIIEDQRLTRSLGESMIEQAATFARELDPSVSVSINVSASHFTDATFVPFILRTLERFDISPSRLTIEITETEEITSAEGGWAVARQLREMGVGLAIDDFGTGYASLERLTRFPSTQLKLDRSLISKAAGTGLRHVLAGFSAMSAESEIEIVAEGVELAEHASLLLAIGLPLAQGYFFDRPMSIPEARRRYASLFVGLQSTASAAVGELGRPDQPLIDSGAGSSAG